MPLIHRAYTVYGIRVSDVVICAQIIQSDMLLNEKILCHPCIAQHNMAGKSHWHLVLLQLELRICPEGKMFQMNRR